MDYHFVSEAEFEQLAAEKAFLEWEKNHGNYYGTSFAALTRSEANVNILEIDIKGAIRLRRKMKGLDFIFVWVNEDSLEKLAERIRERSDSIKYFFGFRAFCLNVTKSSICFMRFFGK